MDEDSFASAAESYEGENNDEPVDGEARDAANGNSDDGAEADGTDSKAEGLDNVTGDDAEKSGGKDHGGAEGETDDGDEAKAEVEEDSDAACLPAKRPRSETAETKHQPPHAKKRAQEVQSAISKYKKKMGTTYNVTYDGECAAEGASGDAPFGILFTALIVKNAHTFLTN